MTAAGSATIESRLYALEQRLRDKMLREPVGGSGPGGPSGFGLPVPIKGTTPALGTSELAAAANHQHGIAHFNGPSPNTLGGMGSGVEQLPLGTMFALSAVSGESHVNLFMRTRGTVGTYAATDFQPIVVIGLVQGVAP